MGKKWSLVTRTSNRSGEDVVVAKNQYGRSQGYCNGCTRDSGQTGRDDDHLNWAQNHANSCTCSSS